MLGAAAQLGIFNFLDSAFVKLPTLSFTLKEAASISIIAGADGPTAIFLTSMLARHLLAPIAIAAYSYMALCHNSAKNYAFTYHTGRAGK